MQDFLAEVLAIAIVKPFLYFIFGLIQMWKIANGGHKWAEKFLSIPELLPARLQLVLFRV